MVNIELISQADNPHASLVLGHGPKTVKQAGCLLVCLVSAANGLTDHCWSVEQAMTAIDARDGFVGSGLVLEQACNALMMTEDRRHFDVEVLKEHLDKDGLAVIGIDYKVGHSSGFSDADHFVLCFATDKENFVCADPNGGVLLYLDMRTPRYRNVPCTLAEMILLQPKGE